MCSRLSIAILIGIWRRACDSAISLFKLLTLPGSGLAVIFAEATESWNSTIDPTGIVDFPLSGHHAYLRADQWDQLCSIYDSTPSEDL